MNEERVQMKSDYNSLAKLLVIKDKKIFSLKEEKYRNNKEITFLRNENNSLIKKIHSYEKKVVSPSTADNDCSEGFNVEDNDYLHKSYIGDYVEDEFKNNEVIEEIDFPDDFLGVNGEDSQE